MYLTKDALIFGLAYLNGPKATLSFGGEGATMEITPRARAALDCLISQGAAEVAEPWDQVPGREYYRGVVVLGPLAKEAGLTPFSDEENWPTFVKREARDDRP